MLALGGDARVDMWSQFEHVEFGWCETSHHEMHDALPVVIPDHAGKHKSKDKKSKHKKHKKSSSSKVRMQSLLRPPFY